MSTDPNPTTPELPTEEPTHLNELLQKTEQEATLLFEEADSLFTKRSEIKDSHDRYTKD